MFSTDNNRKLITIFIVIYIQSPNVVVLMLKFICCLFAFHFLLFVTQPIIVYLFGPI